jgi:hypothetical protein
MVFIGFRDPPADPISSGAGLFQLELADVAPPLFRPCPPPGSAMGTKGGVNSQKYGDLTSFTRKNIGINRNQEFMNKNRNFTSKK